MPCCLLCDTKGTLCTWSFSLSRARHDPYRVLLLCCKSKFKDAFHKANKHWVTELRKNTQKECQLFRRENTSLVVCELSRCRADTVNLKETRQLRVHGKELWDNFCSEKVFWIHVTAGICFTVTFRQTYTYSQMPIFIHTLARFSEAVSSVSLCWLLILCYNNSSSVVSSNHREKLLNIF